MTVNEDDARDTVSPSLVPSLAAPAVGFLELFYDLVFVAATMVLSNTFSKQPTLESALTTALVFTLLWLLWFHTTTLANVERTDDFSHRALVLVQMFLITLTVVAFANKETSDNDFLGLSYALAVLVVAVMHHRAPRRQPSLRAWAMGRRNRLLLVAALVLATTWMPDRYDDVAFVLAIVLLVAPSALGSGRRVPLPSVDVHHLVERAALLTLIMCGEAFVKVSLVASQGTIEWTDVLAMVVEFVGVFAVFFMYFDDIPRAGVRSGMARAEMWALAHLPLQIGIVAVAVGISKFIQVGQHEVHDEVSIIMGVGFGLVYGGLALLGVLGQRTPVRPLTVLRLASLAVTIVMAVLSWSVGWFTPAQMLMGLAGLAVVHAALANRLLRSTTVPAGH